MPHSAAGCRIEPPVSVPSAHGASAGRDRGGAAARGAAGNARRGPTGCAPGRRPSSRWRSPSRTRPGWSCRAAGRPPPRARRRRSPCTAVGSPRGSSSPLARNALGAEQVLDRERDAGERLPARRARIARGLVGDPDERVQLVGRRPRPVELEQLGRIELAGADRRCRLRRRSARAVGASFGAGAGLGTRSQSAAPAPRPARPRAAATAPARRRAAR